MATLHCSPRRFGWGCRVQPIDNSTQARGVVVMRLGSANLRLGLLPLVSRAGNVQALESQGTTGKLDDRRIRVFVIEIERTVGQDILATVSERTFAEFDPSVQQPPIDE